MTGELLAEGVDRRGEREKIRTWGDVRSGLDRWGVLDTATRRTVHREAFAMVIRPLAQQLRSLDPLRDDGPVQPRTQC